MASPPQHTYLITGATRGIGHALLAHYLALPSNLLIAGVRDPSSSTARALTSLPHGAGSALLVVKIDSLADQDAAAAMHTLRTTHGVAHLDTVIANAGIMTSYDRMADVEAATLRRLVDVNAVAPLLLFQAARPLLLAAAPRPAAFVLLGSPVGSLAGMEARPFPMGAYGASKAMAHYVVRKIHAEEEGLVAFVVDPGFVQTELGNEGARTFGMPEAPVTVKDSVAFLAETIDGATREKSSGRFLSIEGGEYPW